MHFAIKKTQHLAFFDVKNPFMFINPNYSDKEQCFYNIAKVVRKVGLCIAMNRALMRSSIIVITASPFYYRSFFGIWNTS